MTVIERWDDDHCPKSKNADGSHCNHADSHDMCDWCGAQWGCEGVMLVPVERLKGAVAAAREVIADWDANPEYEPVSGAALRAAVEEAGTE